MVMVMMCLCVCVGVCAYHMEMRLLYIFHFDKCLLISSSKAQKTGHFFSAIRQNRCNCNN